MKLFLAGIFLGSLLMAETPFSCNLNALTAADRKQLATVSEKVFGAVSETKERPDGYSFRIATDKIKVPEVATWISLEQRCCPFFGFQVAMEPERGPVWLHITGRTGVKDFIRSEFKIGR